MKKFLTLNDVATLVLNKAKEATYEITREGKSFSSQDASQPNMRFYFLEEAKKLIFGLFSGDHELWLNLTQLDLPVVGNRKDLCDAGCDFMFDIVADELPTNWNFYKDITKDSIAAKFDLQTQVTGLYQETPSRGNNLLVTAAIYFTENTTAAKPEEGKYIVALDIGKADNDNGGLITLWQGHEINYKTDLILI